jgi:pilus assembly protein CpaF
MSAADLLAQVPSLATIQPMLDDPTVTEVMVNGPDKIFVERQGQLLPAAARFPDRATLEELVRALAAMVGKEANASSPLVDGRLPDGSRFNAVVAPVAIDGPAITIRKFRGDVMGGADLTRMGAWDSRVATFLEACVKARLNLIVSGGSGTGKTTMLNVLSSFIPAAERIVSIEDAAEMRLANPNVVRLESRPPSAKDPGISARNLVINALRMRPDRIIVGECRSDEALDLLLAMNTGHDGTMTTVHSNSAREALQRIESMVLLAGTELSAKIVRQYVSRAVQIVVHVAREGDGRRRVAEVIEIGGMEGEVVLTQDVFRSEPGRPCAPTRTVPQCTRLMRDRGVLLPADVFSDRPMPGPTVPRR